MVSRPGNTSRALLVFSAAALTLAAAPEARADYSDDIGNAIGTVLIAGTTVLVTGTIFTLHDIGSLAQGGPPARGWAIAETALMSPQTPYFHYWLVRDHASGERSGALSAFLFIPAAWTSALSAHGIWWLASPNADPGTVLGVSWALGANLAFTTGAVGSLFHKRRVPPLAFGVLEMIGTTPTILVSAAQLVDPAGRDKEAWAGLTAWSGVLFLHGAATVAAALVRAGKDGDLDDAGIDAKKHRMGFAPRVFFAPTMVTDGVRRAPGIGVSGVF